MLREADRHFTLLLHDGQRAPDLEKALRERHIRLPEELTAPLLHCGIVQNDRHGIVKIPLLAVHVDPVEPSAVAKRDELLVRDVRQNFLQLRLDLRFRVRVISRQALEDIPFHRQLVPEETWDRVPGFREPNVDEADCLRQTTGVLLLLNILRQIRRKCRHCLVIERFHRSSFSDPRAASGWFYGTFQYVLLLFSIACRTGIHRENCEYDLFCIPEFVTEIIHDVRDLAAVLEGVVQVVHRI